MNGRQAAKAAAVRIEELERRERLAASDIRQYNKCILHMINHGSPCDYCEDKSECEAEGKDITIGCDDWLLAFNKENTDGTNANDQRGGKQAEYTVDSEGNILGETVQ